MNKKLIAVAVAGAFGVPSIAAAQVTVSGKFGVQLVNLSISDANVARATFKKSETFLTDNTSIIRFAAVEDLGGGMEAFGQYELRPMLENGGGATAGVLDVGSKTAVNFVGLRSKAWGSIRAGTDVTFADRGAGLSPNAGAQFSTSGSQAYVNLGGTAVSFSASRQQNLIIYDTPDFGNGFKFTGMWSSNPNGLDADLATAGRAGRAWYLFPEFNFGSGRVGYKYADIKDDQQTWDLKANGIWGEVTIAGIETGLTYSKIKAKLPLTGATIVDVNKWLIPVRYRFGNSVVAFTYSKSGDDKVQAGDQSAKHVMLAYNYNLSKRTNVGITYAKMTNAAGGNFDLTSTTTSGYASAGSSADLGEDQRLIALSLNHTF